MYDFIKKNSIDTSDFVKNEANIYKRICTERGLTMDDVFSEHEIRDVYEKSNIQPGRVCISDLDKIYKRYLKPLDIHLVVVSKKYFDERIFDSRYNKNGQLMVLTDHVIFVWLNDNHYDLILSFRTFSEKNLLRFEYSDSDVCKTDFTCLKCYMQNCSTATVDYKKKCNNCKIIFESESCFNNCIKNAFFKSKCKKKFLLCCYRLVNIYIIVSRVEKLFRVEKTRLFKNFLFSMR